MGCNKMGLKRRFCKCCFSCCFGSEATHRQLLKRRCVFQARVWNRNPNVLVRISSGGLGFFPVKGWGPKSSVCPSKIRETRLFWRDIPGLSPGYPRGCPKSLREKVRVQCSSPSFADFLMLCVLRPILLRPVLWQTKSYLAETQLPLFYSAF